MEIQLFPKFKEFALSIGYDIVLSEKQNWYPDISFVKKNDPAIKFAVDLKTTYRLPDYDGFAMALHLGHMENILEIGQAQKMYSSLMVIMSLICV